MRTASSLFAILASAAAATAIAAAAPPAGKPQTAAAAAARALTPDDHVRRFYAWYLGSLRAGRRPFADDAGLKRWLTDAEIAALRAQAPAGFDPVLGLPLRQSAWANMSVRVGKPTYYHRSGRSDAYVDVRYSGFARPAARTKGGTRFVDIVDSWTIGLSRTRSGWRIASIGARE